MLRNKSKLNEQALEAIKINQILSMLHLMDEHMEERAFASGRHAYTSSAQKAQHAAAFPVKKFSIFKKQKRILAPPRYFFNAKILLYKNNRHLHGHAVNISKSGIFVATGTKVFEENEKIKLTIRPTNSNKVFNIVARVVRFVEDPRLLSGYGLQFVKAR